jgi:hypothetical protein
MTQRKFKHKTSGIEYKYENGAFMEPVDFQAKQIYGQIPVWVAEQGQDWQEITEPELVEGRWVVNETNTIGRIWHISGDGYVELADCFDIDDEVIIGSLRNRKERIEREATPEEIHKALDAIRKEKGLVEGVKLRTNLESGLDGGSKIIIGNDIEYNPVHDSAFIKARPCNVIIYKQSQWAKKVQEPILTTQDGYEIKDPDQDLWLADLADYEAYPIHADEEAIESQDYIFYKYSNAKQYVDEHKPEFSIAELKR